ncbi:hypothetical protein [Sphingobium yanoikuyae]|jgi:hypothetical protein|uniref:hypothetical protein n=1 Tax=Sphingobium yanoikuyae TaxID=13690 RepID=UPI0004E3302C|nr:hypothetical protein [Sphingobium yanoikuyae]KFD30066.1 hypothetical protein IH86_01455 [Sphingobium yanoikuyae]MDV3477914.1 hypothetical protein [Sphingobium yanoikuyae]
MQVENEWEGWDGETIVKLTDGSVWRQEEYHYEYRYAYRPTVVIQSGRMFIEGMSRGILVSRLD